MHLYDVSWWWKDPQFLLVVVEPVTRLLPKARTKSDSMVLEVIVIAGGDTVPLQNFVETWKKIVAGRSAWPVVQLRMAL